MMRTSTTALVLLGLAGLLALPGCGTSSAAPLVEDAGPPPVNVTTAKVALGAVPKYLALTGQLKSGRETDLAANASGRVTGTKVERGTEVKAGEVLATLDVRAAALSASEAKAYADTAAATAASNQTECARVRTLVASGALGKAEQDRMEAQCKTSTLAVDAAQARSQLAAQNVGDGMIRAPFAGVVTERYVDVGEFVRQDSKVVTLVDLSALRLELTVPEANIAAATRGAKLSFTVAGYPDKAFGGTLKFVSASVRAATRDVVAEATLDDPGPILRPGMFASVRLGAGEERLPVVPKAALLTRDGKSSAFIVKDGRLEQRVVQTGEVLGSDVAVMRGLAENEDLVVPVREDLKNGQRVAGAAAAPGAGSSGSSGK